MARLALLLSLLSGCWPVIPGRWSDYDTADTGTDTSDSGDTDSGDTDSGDTDSGDTDTGPACLDPWEPNDAPNTAHAVNAGSTTQASLCTGDVDWYRVSAAGCRVDPAVSSALTLDLTIQDGFVQVSGDAALPWPWIPTGDLALAVASPTGASGDYALALPIDCSTGTTCPADDRFEPNDALGSAPITPGGTSVDAVVCSSNADWYLVPVPGACLVDVAIDFVHAAGDLDLYLYDGAGTLLDQSIAVTDGEALRRTTSASGWLGVRVAGFSGAQNTYGLDVSVDCGYAAPTCPDDDRFEFNDTQGTAMPIEGYDPLFGVTCGDDDWYRVDLAGTCVVDATLARSGTVGSATLEIVDATGRVLDAAPSGASPGTVRAGGATALWLRVDEQVSGAYSLDWSARCESGSATCLADDAYEPNDAAGDAVPLTWDTTPSANAVACDEEWYVLPAAPGCRAEVELDPTDATGDVDLELWVGGAAIDTSAQGAGVTEVVSSHLFGSDPVYVRVPAESSGVRYALTASLDCDVPTCEGPEEPNDDPGAAYAPTMPLAASFDLCLGDEDWFEANPGDGCVVDFDWTATGNVQGSAGPTGAEEVLTVGTVGGVRWISDGAPILVGLANATGTELTYVASASTACSAAPACPADDVFEPNDVAGEGPWVAGSTAFDAVICPADKDFFRLDLPRDCQVDVHADFVHATADLDVRVRDGAGTVIAYGFGVVDDEHVSFVTPAADAWSVEVYALGSTDTNTYGLALDVDCALPTCPDDDRHEPNDTSLAPTLLQADQLIVAVACDEDWYQVPAPSSYACLQEVVVEAIAADPVEVEVLDLQGATLALGSGASVSARVLASDGLLAHVGGDGASYRLRTDRQDCNLLGRSCPTADVWEPNDSGSAATLLATGTVIAGSVCAESDWFQVGGLAGCTLQVDVLYTGGDLDVSVTDLAGTVLATGIPITGGERASIAPGVDGPLRVGVVPVGGSSLAYEMTTTLTCP